MAKGFEAEGVGGSWKSKQKLFQPEERRAIDKMQQIYEREIAAADDDEDAGWDGGGQA